MASRSLMAGKHNIAVIEDNGKVLIDWPLIEKLSEEKTDFALWAKLLIAVKDNMWERM